MRKEIFPRISVQREGHIEEVAFELDFEGMVGVICGYPG